VNNDDLVAEEYRWGNRARPDGPDAIAEAFKSYVPAPRELPRPRVEHSLDDLRAVAGTTAEVRHYEATGNGITEHVERVEICAPITNTERNEQ
jgi:hypothetical protein